MKALSNRTTPLFPPTLVMLIALVVAFAMMSLSGCAQLGIQPKTFNDQALVAATAVDEVQKTTVTLLNAKKISSSDAENVLKTADMATAGIAVARQIHATDPGGASAKLNAAIAVVAAMQAYLVTKRTGT